MFLTMRAAHVLLAAIWFGAVTANVFFVIPAIQEAKSAGGQVMGILTRRGYITFLQAVSGIVTLTGFYLYYHLTQGFNPIVSGSMPARVFGAGGVAAVAAGLSASPHLSLLGAVLAVSCVVAPWAACAALRVAYD